MEEKNQEKNEENINVESKSSDVEIKNEGKEKGDLNIGMAVISYFLFFVPLLTDSKDDPFVKFHVKQGLILFLVSIAYYVLRTVWIIGNILWYTRSLFLIAYFVLLIMGVLNAINGQKKYLPVIGKFADKWFKF